MIINTQILDNEEDKESYLFAEEDQNQQKKFKSRDKFLFEVGSEEEAKKWVALIKWITKNVN